MSPVLNWPPVADSVCVTESLFVTCTVEPGATLAAIGMNMKLEMVIDSVCTAEEADADGEPDDPPLQPARSRAAATTGTTTPLRIRRLLPRTTSNRLAGRVERQWRTRCRL